MRLTLAIALALGSLSAAGVASAANSPVNGNFNVTANVAASCRITASPDLAFPDYDPVDTHATTAQNGQSSISVRCTKGTVATVALGQGNNAATGSTCAAPLRQMASGAERLRYDLYQNGARTTVWGCQTTSPSNAQTFTSTSSVTPTVLQTYGRIPPGQDVASGAYTDTVSIAVTF